LGGVVGADAESVEGLRCVAADKGGEVLLADPVAQRLVVLAQLAGNVSHRPIR
jgi:hypothetical protein